jgi:nucleoside-diphosphate-sugar epimerase
VAFVTGANGFVGHYLVEALSMRGCAVRVLALPNEDTSALERDNVTIYQGDVRLPQTLVEPMRGADTVFHLAGIHGPWRPKQDYYSVNIKGTENVCRAALAAGTGRLVHVSTWAVYGTGLGRALDESLALKPLTDQYTLTKAEADRLVQRFIVNDGLPAVVVRPGIMFGPGDKVNFVRMADRLRARRAIIIGSGRNPVVFVYVRDVVEGIILAATQRQAVAQVYNLSNDRAFTQEELWRAIAEEIGSEPPRLHVPYRALYALAYLSELLVNQNFPRRQPLVTRLGVALLGTDNRVSSAKARRELGYSPRVSLREGVHLTARWYLQQRGGAARAVSPERQASGEEL